MLVQCNNSSGILLGCLQLGNFFFCLEEVRVWSSVIIFYGVVVWDPGLILAQIVYFQCLYYVTLSFFLAILIGTHVSRMILVYFFDLITIITSTFTVYMLYVIERAKKYFDFSVTLYIVHSFICIGYGGWLSSITWWIVNGIEITVMALLGKYLSICNFSIEVKRKNEKRKISVHMNLL
ncbi:hypothetical protein AHAS_Ahas19G0195900 [Arachis hypogaea]